MRASRCAVCRDSRRFCSSTSPASFPARVLLYGHMDKQPEFTGWDAGLGPWMPVIRDGKLYGRGGADDGYAVFSSLAAIIALKGAKIAAAALPGADRSVRGKWQHRSARASGCARRRRLGTPALVICLDAECGNYEQLWSTTSLRGNLVGRLHVRVLEQGVHSGMATGHRARPRFGS